MAPPDQSLHPDSGWSGRGGGGSACGTGQVQPTEPRDDVRGIVDEEPLLHRLGWQRRAVGSGDRHFPVLPGEQHRQRARREGGIGDDQSLTGCGVVPRPPEVRQRRITHGRRVRTTPSSSGIVSW